jgi:hypothetical protein
MKDVRIIKIQILGDDDALFPQREVVESFVGCPVSRRYSLVWIAS